MTDIVTCLFRDVIGKANSLVLMYYIKIVYRKIMKELVYEYDMDYFYELQYTSL